jgi:hypothetical protein
VKVNVVKVKECCFVCSWGRMLNCSSFIFFRRVNIHYTKSFRVEDESLMLRFRDQFKKSDDKSLEIS